MGLDRLRVLLRRHRQIALDTSVFIYQLEGNDLYLPLTDYIFEWLERVGSRAVTSTITMTELLEQPYRNSDEQRVDEFYGLLSSYPNLEWIAPDVVIADLAAQFQAAHRLRTPDALQAATAAHSGLLSGIIRNSSKNWAWGTLKGADGAGFTTMQRYVLRPMGPGGRTEPFFPLGGCRSSAPTNPRNPAGLPATRLAFALNDITWHP